MGLMSVAKLQVSLVRLVRSTMLESLPACLRISLFMVFVGSRSQIRAHGVRSGPPYLLKSRLSLFIKRTWRCAPRLATHTHQKTIVMRRVSMAVLKATARHTLRGLEIITPQAMHTHTARRAKSEAAREADFDEHRWDVRAFGCAGHDGRTRC